MDEVGDDLRQRGREHRDDRVGAQRRRRRGAGCRGERAQAGDDGAHICPDGHVLADPFGAVEGDLLDPGDQGGGAAQVGERHVGGSERLLQVVPHVALAQDAGLERGAQLVQLILGEAGGGDRDAERVADLVGDAVDERRRARFASSLRRSSSRAASRAVRRRSAWRRSVIVAQRQPQRRRTAAAARPAGGRRTRASGRGAAVRGRARRGRRGGRAAGASESPRSRSTSAAPRTASSLSGMLRVERRSSRRKKAGLYSSSLPSLPSTATPSAD